MTFTLNILFSSFIIATVFDFNITNHFHGIWPITSAQCSLRSPIDFYTFFLLRASVMLAFKIFRNENRSTTEKWDFLFVLNRLNMLPKIYRSPVFISTFSSYFRMVEVIFVWKANFSNHHPHFSSLATMRKEIYRVSQINFTKLGTRLWEVIKFFL